MTTQHEEKYFILPAICSLQNGQEGIPVFFFGSLHRVSMYRGSILDQSNYILARQKSAFADILRSIPSDCCFGSFVERHDVSDLYTGDLLSLLRVPVISTRLIPDRESFPDYMERHYSTEFFDQPVEFLFNSTVNGYDARQSQAPRVYFGKDLRLTYKNPTGWMDYVVQQCRPEPARIYRRVPANGTKGEWVEIIEAVAPQQNRRLVLLLVPVGQVDRG